MKHLKLITALVTLTLCVNISFAGFALKKAIPTRPIDTQSSLLTYENITNEVLQLQSYLDKGLYLEIESLCNNLKNKNLSENDKTLISDYKMAASMGYIVYTQGAYRVAKAIAQAYFSTNANDSYLAGINIMKKALTRTDLTDKDISILKMHLLVHMSWAAESEGYNSGYVSTWGMSFLCDKNSDVKIYGEYPNEFVEIGTGISMYSTPINWEYPNKEIFVSKIVKYIKNNTNFSDNFGGKIEVLSENDTTVGVFPARQLTLRIVKYTNRHQTTANYQINRFIAFEYDGWIYGLEANENAYLWSDDFWNKMELVRNTITFY